MRVATEPATANLARHTSQDPLSMERVAKSAVVARPKTLLAWVSSSFFTISTSPYISSKCLSIAPASSECLLLLQLNSVQAHRHAIDKVANTSSPRFSLTYLQSLTAAASVSIPCYRSASRNVLALTVQLPSSRLNPAIVCVLGLRKPLTALSGLQHVKLGSCCSASGRSFP